MRQKPEADKTASAARAASRHEILRRKAREWRDPNDPDWAAHHDEIDGDDPSMPNRDD